MASPPDMKVGLAKNVRTSDLPIHGLRHPPEADTSGWFIWAGEELSDHPDFFEPTHVGHLAELIPEVMPYLALPPGWRFLIAPGHEEVWEDPSLREPPGSPPDLPMKTSPSAWTKWGAAHPFANGVVVFLIVFYMSFVFRQPLWFGVALSGATGAYAWIGWRDGGYLRGLAEKRYGPLD